MTTPKTKTPYEAIKDIPVTDFLGENPNLTLKAHELWKDQPTVVIGMCAHISFVIL